MNDREEHDRLVAVEINLKNLQQEYEAEKQVSRTTKSEILQRFEKLELKVETSSNKIYMAVGAFGLLTVMLALATLLVMIFKKGG